MLYRDFFVAVIDCIEPGVDRPPAGWTHLEDAVEQFGGSYRNMEKVRSIGVGEADMTLKKRGIGVLV